VNGRAAAGHRRSFGAVCAAVLVAASAVGCRSNGTSITTPFDTRPPVLQHGPAYELKSGQIAGLGTVVVDGQGITLYTYAADHRGLPSRCAGICEVQWPPLVLPSGVDRPLAGPGVRSALLGTAPRTDGSVQVTYDGWPLYLWPPDRAPGQATGQALTNAGGLWYVLRPDGSVVVTAA
jgi:predicted lipoprotein with Yx(FWY)xxD motif